MISAVVYFVTIPWIFFSSSAEILPFHRDRTSPLVSGHASKERLKRVSIKVDEKTWLKVRWSQHVGWLPATDVIRSQQTESVSPYGQFIVINDTRILEAPQGSFEAPQGSILEPIAPLTMEGDWIAVKYLGREGFVDTKDVITQLNYAKSVSTAEGNFRVTRRQSDRVWVKDKPEPILMSQCHRIEVFRTWALVRPIETYAETDNPIQTVDSHGIKKKLRPLQPVRVDETHRVAWHQGLLRQHGEIWWREPPRPTMTAATKLPKTYTISDIFPRDVYSWSEGKTSKTPALISANGIFMTQNGHTWHRLPQFAEEDHPVLVGPNDELYVGPYVSYDKGQNFAEYVRWDELLALVRRSKRPDPYQLTFRELDWAASNSNPLQVVVDTGGGRLKAALDPQTGDWVLL